MLKLILISISLFLQSQTLLRNNATASFFSAQLAGTQWSVEDVISFLSKHSEDTRPHGMAFTWRDVFNETDQAIMGISRFMEVRTALFHATFSFLFSSYTFPFYLIIHLSPTYILSQKKTSTTNHKSHSMSQPAGFHIYREKGMCKMCLDVLFHELCGFLSF